MSLLDGRYEEQQPPAPRTPQWVLALYLAVPLTLVAIGVLGLRDRRVLIVPILLLIAARIFSRRKRPPSAARR